MLLSEQYSQLNNVILLEKSCFYCLTMLSTNLSFSASNPQERRMASIGLPTAGCAPNDDISTFRYGRIGQGLSKS